MQQCLSTICCAQGYDLSFVRNQTNFVEFYNMSSDPWQARTTRIRLGHCIS